MDAVAKLSNDAINRLCCFMVHRYLSDFLKTKINPDQFSVNLLNGSATVVEVEIDTELLNKSLEANNVPLVIEDGFIKVIVAKIPFTNPLEDSCEITIRGLEMTLKLIPGHALQNEQADLVTSMIGSMVGSMATSMEIAEEYKRSSKPDAASDKSGAESFAEVVDVVVSRFRTTFEDAVIRIETPPDTETGLCTAVELRVDWFEFIDRQMEDSDAEACKKGLSGSAKGEFTKTPEKFSMEEDFEGSSSPDSQKTVIEQPLPMTGMKDLDKVIHMKGVRLYTDIFSKPENDPSISQSSSMFVRRERGKAKKSFASDRASTQSIFYMPSEESLAQSNYQSCYSDVDPSLRDLLSLPPHPSCSEAKSQLKRFAGLESNPIQFAEFTGERISVYMRIREGIQRDRASNQVISLVLDGLFIFVTPSQIQLINDILGKVMNAGTEAESDLCGRHIAAEDQERLRMQLRARKGSFCNHELRASTSSSAFRNSYDRQRSTESSEGLANISLSSSIDSQSFGRKDRTRSSLSTYSKSTVKSASMAKTSAACEYGLNKTTISFGTKTFLMVVSHKDYLGDTEMQERLLLKTATVAEVVDSFRQKADHFFEKARPFVLNDSKELKDYRNLFDGFFNEDHLRFSGVGVSFDYSLTKELYDLLLQLEFGADKLEFLEVLTPASIKKPATSDISHIELIHFPVTTENSDKKEDFSLSLKHRKIIKKYDIQLDLSACSTELDMSLIDRISSLLVTKPFYEHLPDLIDLRTECPAFTSDSPTEFFFVLRCPAWELNLRFPVANLSDDVNRPPYWMRNLHDETLKLVFHDACVQMSGSDMSELSRCGSVTISASQLYGSFLSKNGVLGCCGNNPDQDDIQFLFAGNHASSEDVFVRIHFNYDFRDSSLKEVDPNKSITEASKSMYASCMQTGEQMEGPFSVDVTLFETEKAIRVGNQRELNDFGVECAKHSMLNIDIDLDRLRLHLPGSKFYEVLYNRLANDLCLWQCSSPLLKSPWSSQAAVHNAVEDDDVDDQLFLESVPKGVEDGKLMDSKVKMRRNFESAKPHSLCVMFKAADCKVIISEMTKDKTPKISSQVCLNLKSTQMFAVTGYHAAEGVTYFYVTSKEADVYHRNIGEKKQPYVVDVAKNDFAKCNEQDACIVKMSPGDGWCPPVGDNNFSIAVHMDFLANKNVKNILVACGLNDSTFRVPQLSDLSQLWVTKLANFFIVDDYAVPGYVIPVINMQVHAHFASTALSYTHADADPEAITRMRFLIGSCDISCDVVPDCQEFKFGCILEESKLLIALSDSKSPRVKFEKKQRSEREGFIEVLSVDNFQIEVLMAGSPIQVDEVTCKHGLIKLHVCADSLARLVKLVTSLTEKGSEEYATASADAKSPERTNIAVGVHDSSPDTTAELEEELRYLSLGDETTSHDFTRPKNAFEQRSKEEGRYEGLGDSSRIGRSESDEEYCIVDELDGSGVVDPDGNPRVRYLVDKDSVKLTPDYLKIPTRTENVMLPKDHPIPNKKYCVNDFSLELHLHGGNDFGKRRGAQRVYSSEEYREGKGPGQRISPEEKGGAYRDHSVHVAVDLSKISFEYGMFDGGTPMSCYTYFSIKNLEVRDKVVTSKIDKMVYQFYSADVPKRESAPMLAVRMVKNRRSEAKLRISMLPIRLNLDLDTLEFLRDFFKEFSSHRTISDVEDGLSVPFVPEFEVSAQTSSRLYPKVPSNSSLSFAGRGSSRERKCGDAKSTDVISDVRKIDSSTTVIRGDIIDQKSDESVQNLFDPKGINLLINSDDVGAAFLPSMNSVNSRFSYHPKSEKAKMLNEESFHERNEQTADECTLDDQTKEAEELSSSSIMAESVQGGRELYFKEFTFSPAVVIRLDFHGRRVITDQGAFIALLSALSNLQCTQLTLKRIHNVDGMFGINRCLNCAVQDWTNDITNNQVSQIIGSYGPISSFVQLARGVRDLLFMPVDEYRKEDGHIVRGLQRGAQSFGFSTAAAAVDIAQKMVGMIQGVAEVAFDIVSPDASGFGRPSDVAQQIQGRPTDLKQGFQMAYEAVMEDVNDAVDVLQRAAQENRSKGHGPLRYIVKQLPPTVLRPVVIGAKATGHVLDGLKSTLSPDVYREEMEKWKKDMANNTGNRI